MASTISPVKKAKVEDRASIAAARLVELLTVASGSSVSVLVYVIAIDADNIGYPVCAAKDDCGQRVNRENDKWFCHECEEELDACKWHLRLKVGIVQSFSLGVHSIAKPMNFGLC